ncbi:MAG: DinB family protein [Candidatus Acidiferrales bacterium]
MKRMLIAVCMMLSLGSAAFGQKLTAEDREKGVKYLEQSRQGIIDATKGLSEAQWKFKPAPDRWSVAEVLEHITLAEKFMYGAAEGTLKAPAGAPDRDYKKTDAAILGNVPDRSTKRQAPDQLVPTGRWSPKDTLDTFLKEREQSITLMKDSQELRAHVSDSPFGPMDSYEWLLFTSAHSERHTKQILEVKADPNFPKS